MELKHFWKTRLVFFHTSDEKIVPRKDKGSLPEVEQGKAKKTEGTPTFIQKKKRQQQTFCVIDHRRSQEVLLC